MSKDPTIDLLHRLQKRIDVNIPEQDNQDLAKQLEKAIKELQIYQAELEMQNEELRQVHNQLEKNRNRYFELFNYAPTGYLLLDNQYRILETNIALLELLDRKRSDIEMKPLLSFVKSSDHRALISLLDEIQSTHDNQRNVIVQFKHSTTRYKTVKIDGRLTSSADFDGKQIMLTASDLTELRRTQDALQESENLYRSLVHSSQDHLFMLSTDGYYLASNEKSQHLCSLSAGKLPGKNISQILPPKNASIYIEKLQQVALNRQPVEFEQALMVEEKQQYFNERLYPIIEMDQLTAIGGISQNITALKEGDFERRKLQAQLYQAQKLESLGNLAGGIAHDFNNILAAIIGYTELAMSHTQESTQLAEDLGEIYRGGIRAKDLVHQILQFARQTEEEKGAFNIEMVVKEVTKFIRSSIPSNITINENVLANGQVYGNETQIYQVLLNLCTNGYQAMDPDGGILSITIEDVDNMQQVKMVVSDTGCGIDSSILNSIFDPYFTTKSQNNGSGMGLAVAHGIIKSHGGTISVESQSGKGSTFTVLLPVIAGGDIQPVVAKTSVGGNESILFVDDEEPITRMSQKVLEKLGYSVETCNHSVKALEIFSMNPQSFDLVITDMTMPVMTGDKLAQEMMRIRPDIPVILCSGFNKNINSEMAQDLGVKLLVEKPLILTDFSQAIREAIDG